MSGLRQHRGRGRIGRGAPRGVSQPAPGTWLLVLAPLLLCLAGCEEGPRSRAFAAPASDWPTPTAPAERTPQAATPTAKTGTPGDEPDDSRIGPALRPAAQCPRFGPGRRQFVVDDPRLPEISGLAPGHRNPGWLYCHNDSGDGARVLAVDRTGVRLELQLPGTQVFDAEDLALALDPGGVPWLYLADTGDNQRQRHMGVFVLRVPEPATSAPGGRPVAAARVQQLHIRYPSGAHDSEALLVDPLTSDVVVITKGRDGHNHVFRVPGAGFDVGTAVAEASGDLHLGLVTAADITPDGRFIIVRTYTEAWVWPRHPDESVAAALHAAACSVPLSIERQGESIAWARDGAGYFTISEGHRQTLYYYPRL